jgi:transcriptional regulator with XRE-family HTH domain
MYKNDPSLIGRAKRLKVLRGMTGLKRDAFAEKAIVSKTSISYWENGRNSGLSEAGAKKIIRAAMELGVHCELDWLLYDLGPPPQLIDNDKEPTTTPILLPKPRIQPLDREQEIATFTGANSDAVVIDISDNALFPVYRKGDKVGGIWQAIHPEEIHITEDYIVPIADSYELKRILSVGHNQHYDLYDLNYSPESVIKNLPLERIAHVIRVWR